MTGLHRLIARNRNFRLLWLGQVVSQLGDWFSSVALYALLYELTGSATAVAGIMVVQMLPLALVSPSAGVVVDRFDRRRIMIAADVLRGVAKDVSMGDIFRGCGWFVFVDIINVAILLAFPQIMLLIPHSMIK
jgi:MFS family permease